VAEQVYAADLKSVAFMAWGFDSPRSHQIGHFKMTLLEHLYDRKFCPYFYGAFVSEQTCSIPLWNVSGKLTGICKYRPYNEIKYITKTTEPSVFGLITVKKNVPLFVVEGVFDAVMVHYYGYSYCCS
jgi:hypothetical protein